MDVLIVGSVAYDSVETAVGKVEKALGGAATYSSVAASFYARPCMVGIVGEDFEDEHIKYLTGCGINLDGLQRVGGKTFHWAGRYLPDMIGRETLDTQLNVFESFNPVLPDEFKKMEYLFLANIHPGLQKQVLDQVEGAKFILFDTMNLWIDTAKDELTALFPKVDVLVINDEEVRMVTGDYNVLRGARKLIKEGVRKGVIVKRGEHGSTLVTEDSLAIAPAYPVEELVDPTGAGDTFAGALIGYVAEQGSFDMKTMRNALLHGSAMASFTVEGFSLDRLRGIKREDVQKRVDELKELMVFD